MEINSEQAYKALMAEIEVFLQKGTVGGSFSILTKEEGDALHRLSLLATAYEDSIPLMPLKIPN